MNLTLKKLRPTFSVIEHNDHHLLLNVTIDDHLRCLKGHFDEFSVVPGVVQLDWAVQFSQEYLWMPTKGLEVCRLKFQKILRPTTEVQLRIVKKSSHESVFRYANESDIFSSGTLKWLI
jgi:3-hydroxymyristoyl/3-hydroxydecanoyl-(acyl carrier protein) dehydratase